MRASFTGRIVNLDAEGWKRYESGTAFRCHIYILPEDEGFSVRAANLPGCVSQGRSMVDALANIKEALIGCILAYRDADQPIPWQEQEREPKEYRATVFVEIPSAEKR